MLSPAEIVSSIAGALRLARFNADGVVLLDTSPAGAWRSFAAPLVLAPVVLSAQNLAATAGEVESTVTPSFPILILAYVISVFAYPAIMEGVTRRLGCRARFPAFVAAYNWAAVIQIAIAVPALLILPAVLPVPPLLLFAVVGYLLAYSWFVLRATLGVPGPVAAGLVALDVAVDLLIKVAEAGTV